MTAAAADVLIRRAPVSDMLGVDKALASLSPDARKTVYAKVWMPIDLNTAKGEEIMLIPGVGRRMRHEFEEYRAVQRTWSSSVARSGSTWTRPKSRGWSST